MPLDANDDPAKHRVRNLFPVSVKLIITFVSIAAGSLLLFNNLAAGIVSRDLLKSTGDYNTVINNRSALDAEHLLDAARTNAYILLDFINFAGKDSPEARQAALSFFERSRYIAAVIVPGFTELINNQFFINYGANPAIVSSWVRGKGVLVRRAAGGQPKIINPSAELGAPLLAMFYPWQENGLEEAAVILFSPERLSASFGNGANLSFMLNDDGDMLVHRDSRMIEANVNLANHPLFTMLKNSDTKELGLVYTEEGVRFFGAGKKLSLGGTTVITSVEYESPLVEIGRGVHRNNYIIVSILFIAVILIWLISKTITRPVKRLTEAVSRMGNGKLDSRLSYRFPDEIGVLSDRFNNLEKIFVRREQFFDSLIREKTAETQTESDGEKQKNSRPRSRKKKKTEASAVTANDERTRP